jgi:hypothetical protein
MIKQLLLEVRNLTTFALMLALLLSSIPSVVLAHDNGQEHAEQDLAGVPMSQIEREAAANKLRIKRATGVEPGAARSKSLGANEATFAAVNADPGQSGSWSPVIDTDVVPVFEAVLPNGKVLMWDSVGDSPSGSDAHDFTRAMVWNPADDTFRRVDVQGYNIFCAGFAHMPNGNIFVAGGTANPVNDGIVQTHIFNWQTETWSRGADMAAERWYPSVTAMANGEQAIVGGGPEVPEIYQANGLMRLLTGFTNPTYGQRVYPFMISRPDTQLGLLGPYNSMYTVNTAGDGATVWSGFRDGRWHDYGSFATFDIGKTMVVGGGATTTDGVSFDATETAVVLNYNWAANNWISYPVVSSTGSMSTGRRQMNATVLADGSVLATGGMSTGGYTVDLNHAVTSAERWDPATGQWTVLSSANRIRQYHSTATLLPDGRVMTGGGGVCGECNGFGYLEKNIEYFSPPYLYKQDGSGDLAARPTITSAPATMGVNTLYSMMVNPGSDIRKVALVGLGDVTHSIDQGQRYIPLNFKHIPIKKPWPAPAGSRLDVTGPASSGVAPPGYYMLFVINSAGVPSVAKIIQVTKGPNPLMSQVRNTGAARCLDVPNSTLAIRTYLQSYTCNNTKAQALTRFPADQTLRVLGNCLDVPNASFVSGARIWTYDCNNSNAQKWQFGTDGTIRPVSKTTLCLTATSTAQNATITITTCSSTNTRQKWTW